MKIIKEGNLEQLHNPQTFECKRCWCIFEATDEEYIYGDCYAQMHDGLYASCVCPCCGETVYLYENEKKSQD